MIISLPRQSVVCSMLRSVIHSATSPGPVRLSLEVCSFANPGDRAGAAGPGARYWFTGRAIGG